jgi:hypothetical protein
MLVIVAALYSVARPSSLAPLWKEDGRSVVEEKVAVLLAAAKLVITAASPAWATPGGQGNGNDGGVGGVSATHIDDGNQKGAAKGEGPNDNPHRDGCQIACG